MVMIKVPKGVRIRNTTKEESKMIAKGKGIKRQVFVVHGFETADGKHSVTTTTTGNLNAGKRSSFDDFNDAKRAAKRKAIELSKGGKVDFLIDAPSGVTAKTVERIKSEKKRNKIAKKRSAPKKKSKKAKRGGFGISGFGKIY